MSNAVHTCYEWCVQKLQISRKTLQKNANITSISELFATLEWVMKGSSLLSLGRWSSVLRSASVRVLQVSSRWTLLTTSSSELLANGRRVQQRTEISSNTAFSPILPNWIELASQLSVAKANSCSFMLVYILFSKAIHLNLCVTASSQEQMKPGADILSSDTP